jgi:hypothetical protein
VLLVATLTRGAAASAASSVSASTIATGWPSYSTASSFIGTRAIAAGSTSEPNLGMSARVSTRTTPGVASAALASIAVTRPAAIGAPTSTPCSRPAG